MNREVLTSPQSFDFPIVAAAVARAQAGVGAARRLGPPFLQHHPIREVANKTRPFGLWREFDRQQTTIAHIGYRQAYRGPTTTFPNGQNTTLLKSSDIRFGDKLRYVK
ncbi:hypothetical protein [Paraburkholderia monticola]|uniref:hypothetical protein n=1 Tax=Paraburkholderia monticola TaxID=1399968 RepID=UPI00137ABB81|nr:hypothetical protein [Paraburkholderia monticola]